MAYRVSQDCNDIENVIKQVRSKEIMTKAAEVLLCCFLLLVADCVWWSHSRCLWFLYSFYGIQVREFERRAI